MFCNCWLLQHRSQNPILTCIWFWPLQSHIFEESISVMTLTCWKGVILKSTDPKNLISCMFITTMVYSEGGFRGFRWKQVFWGFNIEYWSAQLAQCEATSSITVWCIKKPHKNTAFEGENRGFWRKKRVRNVPYKISSSPCWVVFELFNVWTTQTTAPLTGPRAGYVKWTTALGMSIWWKLKLPSKIAISADKHFFLRCLLHHFDTHLFPYTTQNVNLSSWLNNSQLPCFWKGSLYALPKR